jgi:hypothetical protein
VSEMCVCVCVCVRVCVYVCVYTYYTYIHTYIHTYIYIYIYIIYIYIYNIDEVFWASKIHYTNTKVKYILSNGRECEDEVFWANFRSRRINEHDLIAIDEG